MPSRTPGLIDMTREDTSVRAMHSHRQSRSTVEWTRARSVPIATAAGLWGALGLVAHGRSANQKGTPQPQPHPVPQDVCTILCTGGMQAPSGERAPPTGKQTFGEASGTIFYLPDHRGVHGNHPARAQTPAGPATPYPFACNLEACRALLDEREQCADLAVTKKRAKARPSGTAPPPGFRMVRGNASASQGASAHRSNDEEGKGREGSWSA